MNALAEHHPWLTLLFINGGAFLIGFTGARLFEGQRCKVKMGHSAWTPEVRRRILLKLEQRVERGDLGRYVSRDTGRLVTSSPTKPFQDFADQSHLLAVRRGNGRLTGYVAGLSLSVAAIALVVLTLYLTR